MTIVKKSGNKLLINQHPYSWWVSADDDVNSPGSSLHLYVNDGRRLQLIAFQLGQTDETSHAVIFRGDPPVQWRRVRCPLFTEGPRVSQADAIELLQWVQAEGGDAPPVNCVGLISE